MTADSADKTVESGNSRVKVTLYGQVNRAIRFANTGNETEITSVDNDGSSSRIGIRAVGKANPNLTVGALHELEWQENRRSGTGEKLDDKGKVDGDSVANTRVRARHVDLWLDHKNMGKLSMGHGSIAGDAAGLYELTGVSYVYGFAGANGTDGVGADATVQVAPALADGGSPTLETKNVRGKPRGFRPFNFFGARENRIRYDTPSLMGARLSASYNENRGWSVGLSYAGAPPGVKNFSALFAAGYRERGDDSTAWAVSGGIKHASGFNLNAHYDSDGEARKQNMVNNVQNSQWGVSGGWSGKINDSGGTSVGLGYNRSTDGLEGVAQQYWVAIVQNIDAAAADVYAGVSYDSGTATHQVSPAEAATAYTDTVEETQTVDGVDGYRAMPSPCYSVAVDGNVTKAAVGTQCEVEREGVFNFVVGVRIKF